MAEHNLLMCTPGLAYVTFDIYPCCSQNWQEVPSLCVTHGPRAAVCFLSWNMLGSNSWNFSRNALHSLALKSDSFTKLELGGSISFALQPPD
uniref:Uncharacterized protein n=1 Tax=Arundo donax TaxID=35708 RepID=A0A0A9FS78_ARUDO